MDLWKNLEFCSPSFNHWILDSCLSIDSSPLQAAKNSLISWPSWILRDSSIGWWPREACQCYNSFLSNDTLSKCYHGFCWESSIHPPRSSGFFTTLNIGTPSTLVSHTLPTESKNSRKSSQKLKNLNGILFLSGGPPKCKMIGERSEQPGSNTDAKELANVVSQHSLTTDLSSLLVVLN